LDPAGILALDPEGIRALDAPRFAALVAALLRPHIAPAREPLLGDMAASVAAGVASRDPLLIVKGFRILFELLEAMKLDIANHQLQSMRAFLVDTAVDFEQRYFADRISRGKMQLDSTLLWLNRHCKAPALFEGFCTGVVALLELQAPFAQLPQTFQFDQARLSSIRADLHDLLSIQMILLLYRQLICPVTRPAHLDPAILSFKQEILVLIADDIAHSRIKWEKAIPCLALQMARKYAICKTGFCTFPDQHIITSVQSWLLTNLDRKQISPVHQLLQSRVLQYFSKTCLAAIRCNRHFTPISENDSLDSFVGLNDEIQVLARKISGVAVFHYKVMGKLYVRWCM
ncbi:Protein SOK1, partial [Neolecta irregularis DAH-3]